MLFEFDACWPIVFSRDGNQLLTTSTDSKEMTAWSLSTRQKAWSIPHTDRICAMSLSADNRYLATVTIDEPKLRVWDLKNITLPPLVLPADTGKEMAKLDRRVDRIDFSKDAETLVMSGADVYTSQISKRSRWFTWAILAWPSRNRNRSSSASVRLPTPFKFGMPRPTNS